MIEKIIKNPMARKRLKRFKEMRRAYLSFLILITLYLLSFFSEFISNSAPIYVRYEGKSYFPIFFFYPEDQFTGNRKQTRPDYRQINLSSAFKDNPANYMIFTPIPFGPYASIDPESIFLSDLVTLKAVPVPMVGAVNVGKNFTIQRSRAFGLFLGRKDLSLKGRPMADFLTLPPSIKAAVSLRFANQKAPAVSEAAAINGRQVTVFLSAFDPRKTPPRSVRLTLREIPAAENQVGLKPRLIDFDKALAPANSASHKGDIDWLNTISDDDRQRVLEMVKNRFAGPMDDITLQTQLRLYRVSFEKKEVRFPYPPVKGHPMGIDSAGRDVLSRILYGLRTSMTFGLLLVIGSMLLGIAAGSLQGYYGGILDIGGQRLTEIWSALPFLYIMILMGSIYGRSFLLLLICYGLFNWIGISYYMRAEFLRLRKQPFVEAAKCMGISSAKVIFRHILPNGMIPVITFFPFSLVGAIGALAALDYLGFGLPPPTPSWGELLFQAQQYRWAWWLILYPSLALFSVMLLGVFIGEGIRHAYDPKRYTRLK